MPYWVCIRCKLETIANLKLCTTLPTTVMTIIVILSSDAFCFVTTLKAKLKRLIFCLPNLGKQLKIVWQMNCYSIVTPISIYYLHILMKISKSSFNLSRSFLDKPWSSQVYLLHTIFNIFSTWWAGNHEMWFNLFSTWLVGNHQM